LFVTLFKRKGSPIDSMTLLSKSSSTAADRDILVVQSTQTPQSNFKKYRKSKEIGKSKTKETPAYIVGNGFRNTNMCRLD